MWGSVILVFIGGAFGAMLREFLMLLVPHGIDGFPTSIFIANITASFLLGWVGGHHRMKNVTDEFILLLGTGVMGGMSTFSSFAYGAFEDLVTPGRIIISLGYLLASLVLGYIAIWLGMQLAPKARKS